MNVWIVKRGTEIVAVTVDEHVAVNICKTEDIAMVKQGWKQIEVSSDGHKATYQLKGYIKIDVTIKEYQVQGT